MRCLSGRSANAKVSLRPMETFTLVFLAALAAGLVLHGWLLRRQYRHVLDHRGAVPARFRGRVSLEEHIEATKDVECRKDASVIDETPAAYKPIDAVMAAQKDLVEIVHTLRQVVCVKG